ncbi:MAG: protein kinase [Woeseiaceae bacterium]
MSESKTRLVLEICDRWMAASRADRAGILAESCGDDSELMRQVSAVLDVMTTASAELGDHVDLPDLDWVGKTIGDYRLTRCLGEGGMGAVYLAERHHADFKQEVALKVIRGRFLVAELVRRFNAEREILARLNHPYIAQLIDGGTEAGVPYLVMEYVDGIPVDQWLDDRKADITMRLEMIRKIATAVHAAHQNLVVHRDLKPSNVLVTTDGIPKLLDFGIAKLVEAGDSEDVEATVLGQQALTPSYASPEQVLYGVVTTLSDVYSLGVLSYELLAGERPYQLDTQSQATLIESMTSVAIPRPSQRLSMVRDSGLRQEIAEKRSSSEDKLSRRLQGDLDNIVLKALSVEPGSRYVSVAAFSADIGRYIAGQPVEAQPDSVGYRLRRFVTRNRVAVLFSTALIFSLIAGLAATSWSYVRAEAARADATARFDQVRSLAKTMMFDVYDDVAKIPGTASVRSNLASTAQTYLETLAADADAPDDVLIDAAQGYSRLYTILNREAVDDPDDRTRALAAYTKAERILTTLVEQSPANVAGWYALGQLTSNRASDQLTVGNDPDAAEKSLIEATGYLAEAEKRAPNDSDVLLSILRADYRYANLEKWKESHEAAVEKSTALMARLERARARWPDSTGLLVLTGDTYQLRGESNYWIDRYDAAIADYTDSIRVYERTLEVGGDDHAVTSQIADVYWSRGNSFIDTQRPAEAADDFAKAVALVSSAVARDPDDKASQRRMVILRASQAMALVNSGDGDTAIGLMTETNDWFEEQASLDVDTSGPQRSLAISYYMMADIYRIAERDEAACSWFQKALEKWQSVDDRFGLAEFDKGQPVKIRELLADCR